MRKGNTYIRKLTSKGRRTIILDYAAGMSLSKLAKKYRIDRSSAWSFLKRRGVIMRSHSVANRRCKLDQAAFDVLTPESAYWIGFLMADGSVSHREYSSYISVALSSKDRGHVLKFRKFLKSNHKIESAVSGGFSNGTSISRLSVASTQLVNALAKYGVVPNKSFTAKVIGLESNVDFWRGAVDGDGWVGFAHTRYGKVPDTGLVGSKSLCQQFADFCKEAAGFGGKPIRTHRIWAVRMSRIVAIKIIKVLYEEALVALKRKARSASKVIKFYEAVLAERKRRKLRMICGDRVEALGYCRKHYKRYRKHGNPHTVSDRWGNKRTMKATT